MSALRGLIAAGVRNPVYANMLAVCILACGFYAAGALVTETYPEFSLDRIMIETRYPGASAEEVEQGVATLTGSVEDWDELQAAEENAREGGAVSVISQLEIENGGA